MTDLNPKACCDVVAAVDLGGTKMLALLADLDGNILHEVYVPHSRPYGEHGPSDSLAHLCDLVGRLLDVTRPPGQRLRGIGVGAPGITRYPEGVVVWAPTQGWRDLPLRHILSERFGVPVAVENDVNLAALGEWAFGAGRGTRSLFLMAIGTAIGGGIVLDGALYRGHNCAAGEIGYMVPGIESLGRRYDTLGALESLASGTGIASLARDAIPGQATSALTARDVFAAARSGESWAQRVLEEAIGYLALAIANITTVLDPELVILSGGVARSADLLIEPILRRLDGVVPFVPRLVASSLGSRAAALGAVKLVVDVSEQ
jgi:predicted NBD/HSP70 family sugar kinase